MKYFRAKKTTPGGKGRNISQLLTLHGAAIALFLLACVITFLLLFPGQAVRDRVEHLIQRQTGVSIDIGELGLAPIATLNLRNVRWQPELQDWPPVTLTRLELSPRWSTLFGGNPGATVEASISGGEIEGFMLRDGSLEAALSAIALAPFFPETYPYRPQGTLGGTVESTGQALANDGRAAFQLQIDQAALTGLETLGVEDGRLDLGNIRAQGVLQGRNLKVEDLYNQGGDLQISGKATIFVADSPQLSRITAQIEVTPGPGLEPGLRDLLTLSGVKPDRSGTFRFRIAGNLANPTLR